MNSAQENRDRCRPGARAKTDSTEAASSPPGDDLPGERQHQVVDLVPVGGGPARARRARGRGALAPARREGRDAASHRPTDDHGVRPAVLVVFEDEIAADHFLRVARKEMARARVELPLRVSHRALIAREGPLGQAWRAPRGGPPVRPFG